ncbi:ATP-binding SpoIIE family protein phosphatase [Actinacidiphila bryophytorum]|uniref:ATP-binding SpoIIE family protein phosphatase n=1 Tax=Actinacidiphila bryophytorum TaxID=1436133 RepID=UPI002176C838|nr:ATP-binding SpoIIE family protein phosphatase [Actinacidiphila bryophytorum]UWE08498.1 SpoIIE family protein phosphatase [Actinacidiphila bryophytorum]
MRLPRAHREGEARDTASDKSEAVSQTSLPGNQQAAGAARRFLRAALAEWAAAGMPAAAALEERVVDDGTLLVSELVTNAVVHAGTAVHLVCRLEAGEAGQPPPGVVVEVSDRHPARMLRGEAEPDLPDDRRENGRGLQLVAALSDAWGISYRRDRKTVWCRFDLPQDGAEAQVPAPRGEPPAELLAPLPPPAAGRRCTEDWVDRGALSFLAEASDLLAGQLDEDNVASLATQLLVPRIADWCAVWVYPAGAQARLSSVWHGEEHRIDGLRAVLEKSPPAADLPPGARRTAWPATADGGVCDLGGALAVPLIVAGRCHGTLLLGRAGLLGMPDEMTGLVEDFARRVALAMGAARQYARQAMISTVLQRGLLPPAVGRIPGIDHAVVYEPLAGDWVGGDFYDLFPAGDGRWCFALGDVCGNGPEAASLAGVARPVLRLLAREGFGVSDVLDRLNKALADEAAAALAGGTAAWEGGQARFLSLLYGEITPYAPERGAHVTLASAGHPLPLVLAVNGRVREAAVPQILLGISETAQYTSESFDLSPGDSLLCVTDGVTERRRGRRQFDDDDGLATVLGACTGLDAAGIAERVRHAVHVYDTAPPADDLAVLVLQAR